MSKLLPNTALYDSHCHLNDAAFDADREKVVGEALTAGVEAIVDVAIDVDSSRKALTFAREYPGRIYPTVGLHPEVVIPGSDLYRENIDENKLTEMLRELEMQLTLNLGYYEILGECGLDFYWPKVKNLSKQEYDRCISLQKMIFKWHLDQAAIYNKKLTIHCRDCVSEVLDMIENTGTKVEGVIHSFTGTFKEARRIQEMGLLIGINGIITYKKSADLRLTVLKLLNRKVPATHSEFYGSGFVLETDSPYLAPEGKRGQRNSPARIKEIWEFLISL